MSSGELELDDAVSSWWDGFIRYGKRAVTVQQLLTHRAGLHRALPSDLTLSRLADYSEMVRIVEDAAPACAPGALGRYAYLTYGWAVSELVRCVSGLSIDAFIQERLLEPLGLEEEIFLKLPQEHEQKNAHENPSHQPVAASTENTATPARLEPSTSRQQHSPSVGRRRNNSSIRVASAGHQPLDPTPAPGPRHSSLSRRRASSPPDTPDPEKASQDGGQLQQHSWQQKPTGANSRSSLAPGPISKASNAAHLGACEQQAGGANLVNGSIDAEGCGSSSRPSHFPPNQLKPEMGPAPTGRNSAIASPRLSLGAEAVGRTTSPCRIPEGDEATAGTGRGSGALGQPPHLLGKLQLSAFPKDVEIVRADTPILWRLTSARRKISFSPMTQQEVLQRLEQAKGKLESKELNNKEGGFFSSADDAQTRRCIASAMKQRRRRLHNMRGNSGPVETPREQPPSTRSVESLPDVLLCPRAGGQGGDEGQKSEEEGGIYHSDLITEEPGTADSDSETPGVTTAAPGAATHASVLELIRTKPHVMDPLIYDSHRIVHQLIPPTNCRCTARALARFYSALGDGRIISRPLLDASRVAHTVDPTMEALLLTGGGSRTWGLGYQLYECAFLPSFGCCSIHAGQGAHVASALLHSRTTNVGNDFVSRRSRRTPRDGSAFGYAGSASSVPQVEAEALLRDRGLSSSHPWGATLGIKPRGVVGLGHGDAGGSVAICFPERNLSISILLNDVLTGPEVHSISFCSTLCYCSLFLPTCQQARQPFSTMSVLSTFCFIMLPPLPRLPEL